MQRQEYSPREEDVGVLKGLSTALGVYGSEGNSVSPSSFENLNTMDPREEDTSQIVEDLARTDDIETEYALVPVESRLDSDRDRGSYSGTQYAIGVDGTGKGQFNGAENSFYNDVIALSPKVGSDAENCAFFNSFLAGGELFKWSEGVQVHNSIVVGEKIDAEVVNSYYISSEIATYVDELGENEDPVEKFDDSFPNVQPLNPARISNREQVWLMDEDRLEQDLGIEFEDLPEDAQKQHDRYGEITGEQVANALREI